MIVEWIRLIAFFGVGKTWACFHEVGKVPRVQESWNSLLRIGASSRAQVLRAIAGMPSGPLDLEAKTDAKRLALTKGVFEEESEVSFSGGKDDWQKCWGTTSAIDQKEREPAW